MTALAPSRTAGAVKATLAALIALAIVVGMPALLIAFEGAPWTWQVPDASRLDVALSWPVPANTVKWGLVLLAWLIWVCFVIAFVREIALQIAGRRASSQIHGPIRFLAAALTGTVAATAPALAASAEPATVIAAPAEECAAPSAATEDHTTQNGEAADQGPERDADGNILHTVTKETTLWGLADQYYQDPTRYPAIFRANEGIVQANGTLLTDPDVIVDGTKIVIPDTAPPEPPVDEVPDESEPPELDDGVVEPPDPQTEAPASPPQESEDVQPTSNANTPSDNGTAAPAFDRGAWLSVGSFIALSAAAAALVMRRRRRGPAKSDSSPKAPSQPKNAVSVEVEEEPFTGRLVDLEALLERHREADHEISTEPVLSTGTVETDEITTLDHAHGGLGLTGAGAPGVALAAIWSALASGATVIIDSATASRLGLHTGDFALPPELRVVDESANLAEAVGLTQSRVEYEPETDSLAQRSTIIVTNRAAAEQFPATLLDDEATYAIILGKWELAWLDVAADGTPLDGHLDAGPVSKFGQCYLLDAATCNDLIADLADSPKEEASETEEPETPEPVVEDVAEVAAEPAPDGPAPSNDPALETEAAVTHGKFELTLFGRPRLTWDGEEVHFSRNACIDTIAVLALNGWSMTGDELSEAITPDASISQAGARRTSNISAARTTMQSLTGTKEQKEPFITYDRPKGIYHLDATWFHTDLESVADHLRLASETDDPAERTDLLQAALRQYAGPLAADLDEVWDLIDQRRHWQQTLYKAALELAAIYDDIDQDERAAVALERASAIDPDRPEAWERLAAHHRERGETAKADEVEARARHRRETARLAGHQTGSNRR
jgi:DNA-binding SARP family transcriptional activator